MSFDGTSQVKFKLPDDVKQRMEADAAAAAPAENPPAGSTASTPVKRARSINLQEYLEHGLAELKEQLNNYQEVCNKFSAVNWKLADVTDYLYLMIKSLNFDAISVMVVDQAQPGTFFPLVSRGYFHPPTLEVEKFWQQSLPADSIMIDWNHLLDLTQQEKSPLVNWMEEEKIHRIGYSPVQDGDRISGFIIIASYAEKKPSPLASTLLELCGGHIGLALTAQKAKNQLLSQQRNTDNNVRTQLLLLQQNLQQLAAAEPLTPEFLTETLAHSQAIIDQALTALNPK